MKIKRTAATILTLLASSVALAAGPYAAGEADTDFKALLTRWAALDGKRLVWEAGGNASINDPDAINFAAKLASAQTFKDALTRLDNVLDQTTNRSLTAGKTNPPPMLVACIYDDAIVIRTIGQEECGKSL